MVQIIGMTITRTEQITRRVSDSGGRQECGKEEASIGVHKEKLEWRKSGKEGPMERYFWQRTRPTTNTTINYDLNKHNKVWG